MANPASSGRPFSDPINRVGRKVRPHSRPRGGDVMIFFRKTQLARRNGQAVLLQLRAHQARHPGRFGGDLCVRAPPLRLLPEGALCREGRQPARPPARAREVGQGLVDPRGDRAPCDAHPHGERTPNDRGRSHSGSEASDERHQMPRCEDDAPNTPELGASGICRAINADWFGSLFGMRKQGGRTTRASPSPRKGIQTCAHIARSDRSALRWITGLIGGEGAVGREKQTEDVQLTASSAMRRTCPRVRRTHW